MPLNAEPIIEAALARSHGIVSVHNISRAALLGELSYQDRLIVQAISQINPDMLSSLSGLIVLSDTGNQNGYTLEPAVHYRNFVHKDNTSNSFLPINIRQSLGRDSPAGLGPEAFLTFGPSAAIFHPIDPLGKRWLGGERRSWFDPAAHSVTYSYVPQPNQLVNRWDNLSSPEVAEEVLVCSLVLSILLQSPPTNEVEVAVWNTRIQAAMAARDAARNNLYTQVARYGGHPNP